MTWMVLRQFRLICWRTLEKKRDFLWQKQQQLPSAEANFKGGYIDKLDGTVNKYNNAYHRTIKMKPVDVQPSTH